MMGRETDHERQRRLQQQAARSLQHGKKPSLEDQADYYRQRQRDPNTTAKDKRGWKMLADELDRRLGRNAPPSEQVELW